MDIRVNPKYMKAIIKALKQAHPSVVRDEITVNEDANVETAVMLVKDGNRVDVPHFAHLGLRGVIGFLSRGYVPASVGKRCPESIFGRKCIGPTCAKYLIQRNIGDCSCVWSGVWKE